MPLPKASNAQEKEYLDRIYDEYCKIAFKELMQSFLASKNPMPGQEAAPLLAKSAHGYANAMLNERTK